MKITWRLLPLLLALPGMAARIPDEYAIVLADPPLAEQAASRKDLQARASTDRMAKIRNAQRLVKDELALRHIPVTGAVQTLVNAVFVRATAETAQELRSLPGVARVVYQPPVKRHLDRAADLVKASSAWSAVGGEANAGAGVKIGIVDTGIENTHPAFQDESLAIPAGFPKGRPGDLPYTNRKIIVARSYVAQLPFADVQPEDSRPDDVTPRDRSGHGTAVAMIAAGVRNSGPSATIVGIAPKAWLGNYKIFGSTGINDSTTSGVLVQAIEDAVNDGMDIITLSVGSAAVYGPLDRLADCRNQTTGDDACDVRAQALENAVNRLGLTVVVSAGNDGDAGNEFPTLNSIHTPGTAPSAITVGASTNSHIFFAGLKLQGDGVPAELQNVRVLFGDGPRPNRTLTAPLRDVSGLQDDGKACSPLANGSLSGAIALIERGTCGFAVKINNAQKAGALGVVIYRVDGSNFLFTPTGNFETGIPAVLAGNDAGAALKAFLVSNPDRPVTLDTTLQAYDADFDTVAFFSSLGPSTGESGIKPELVAVGTDMYTATQTLDPNGDLYDPSGYTSGQGTSFAVPMVAGVAAIVKQRNPRLTPAQLKSAVVNTAADVITGSQGLARVTSVGAGKLNAEAAVAIGLSIDPAVLSFGAPASGSLPISRSLRLSNTTEGPLAVQLSVAARDRDNNARLTITPSSLTVDAGRTVTVTVRLEGTRPPPGNYEGVIAIRAGDTNLRVPYLYLIGDGVVANVLPLRGSGFKGAINDQGWLMALKAIDRFGVPVSNASVRFRVGLGGGSISSADATTDILGIAAANVDLGPQLGEQQFTAEIGGQVLEFNGNARLQPVIATDGVVSAASFQVGAGLAPGSTIAIRGAALSNSARAATSASLPLILGGASVSFDNTAAGLSVPGRIQAVSESQVIVQIPWELQGLNSVRMKVTAGEISSAVYSVPLTDYSPGVFEAEDASGRRFANAFDEAGGAIGSSNPAKKGSTLVFFASGLGPVDNQPASGDPGPVEPLARTRVQPLVTIGGKPAVVAYAGLAPGRVGVYQINAIVPLDSPGGVQTLAITANGIEAPNVTIPVE